MEQKSAEQLTELNQRYREMNEFYGSYAKHCGWADSVMWILYSLWESEKPYTQAELCKSWMYSKQTVNSALKQLKEKGMIQLKAKPNDRKSKQIFLTQEGRRAAEEKIVPLVQAEQRALQKMESEEREEYLRLMRKYVALTGKEIQRTIEGAVEEI